MKSSVSTEDPDLAERFDRILQETVEAMEGAGIRYAFIGGIASGGLGRPRSTHDIDLFVTPEDAELALRALARKGFRTDKTDPAWLYKGYKDDILVDVIFKSKGDIYLDPEMYQRMTVAEYHGRRLRLVAPEDLLIIKAVAHSELTPSHWHDAIALLSHARMDWDYLVKRAKKAPRRVLSLLLYAQSNDVGVPNRVIHTLYQSIFGDMIEQMDHGQHGLIHQAPREERFVSRFGGGAGPKSPVAEPTAEPKGAAREYQIGHLQERLAEDPRTNELDLHVEQEGDRIVLKGTVAMAERRGAAEQLARETFPGSIIDNQIRVLESDEPTEAEKLS